MARLVNILQVLCRGLSYGNVGSGVSNCGNGVGNNGNGGNYVDNS